MPHMAQKSVNETSCTRKLASPHPCDKHCTCQGLSSQHEQVGTQQAGLDIF